MYGLPETSAGGATLAATGVAITTGSWILLAFALVALGGLVLTLGRRFAARGGPKP
ncbi:MAG: hypothetical protein ACK5KU_10120 [Beutenbergiaceae bacterium]